MTKSGEILNLQSFGCVAHSLQLVIKKFCFGKSKSTQHRCDSDSKEEMSFQNEIPELIQKIRQISGSLRHYSKRQKFRQLQIELKCEKFLEPIVDQHTRWSSTFFMIKRFIELDKLISSKQLEDDYFEPLVIKEEFRILRWLLLHLEKIYEATNGLQSDIDITISQIIPIIESLKTFFNNPSPIYVVKKTFFL